MMPLPNLEKMVPTFSMTIPSTQQVVTFRPFLVKEEKILLIALEANDEKAMLDAVLQVVSGCAIGPLKPDSLANFDIEYIFLQLRSHSINDSIDLSYRCHNKVAKTGGPPGSCDNIVKIPVNLNSIQIKFNPEHKKQIFLTETMGVNMRYPNYKMEKIGDNVSSNISEVLKRIAMCIESVFDDKSVYTGFSVQEISEWIEKLTQAQFVKIQEFFSTMPVLAHDALFHCPKCDYQETIHVEGLASFFV
jgi:hypothetical protein